MSAFNRFIHNATAYFREADDPLDEFQLDLLRRIPWKDLQITPRRNKHGQIIRADVEFYGDQVGAAYGSEFVLSRKAQERTQLRGMADDISDLLYR